MTADITIGSTKTCSRIGPDSDVEFTPIDAAIAVDGFIWQGSFPV